MRNTLFAVCAVAAVLTVVIISASWADVIITLKNGKTIKVDVDKKDIVSISFDEKPGHGPGPGPGHRPGGNWDFESGTLNGWTATGTAFNTQPTYGDNPTARNRGQASNHQGNYWIGGYENRPSPSHTAGAIQGDGPQGTLTSNPFPIRKENIRFLIGGGCDMNSVRAELIVDGQMVRQSTGRCNETMFEDSWDVSAFRGKHGQIRLVDNASGGWGHINFDYVRFTD